MEIEIVEKFDQIPNKLMHYAWAKSIDISCAVRCFYETESEIWDGFSLELIHFLYFL